MSSEAAKTTGGDDNIAQLDDLFAPWNRTDAPGLSVGIMRDGKPLYRRGFGMASLETGVAITPQTSMRIASVSKHFTALAALLLSEDGLLDLDASIGTYVPELGSLGGSPTLRLLLQHRGGQRCYLDVGYYCRGPKPPPTGTALALHCQQSAQNFVPGDEMMYNNGGYHLISIAMERASGKPLEKLFQERLFEPLGMMATVVAPSDFTITPGIATLHVPLTNEKGWRRGLLYTEESLGDGAIVSSADDMLLWMAHLRLRDRFGVPATWAALTEQPVFPDGTIGNYALGLIHQTYRGRPVLRHSGGVVGGSSEMLTFPDDGLDIVILANGAPNATPWDLAKEVADICLRDSLGEPKTRIAIAGNEGLLGDWISPNLDMVYSFNDDGGHLGFSYFGASHSVPIFENGPGSGRGQVDGLADTAITLALDLSATEMPIQIGASLAKFSRVDREAIDRSAFFSAVLGKYSSADANATATIFDNAGVVTIRFGDQYGCIEAVVNPVTRSAALTAPALDNGHRAILAFDIAEGSATGFLMSTTRTRKLEFRREPRTAFSDRRQG